LKRDRAAAPRERDLLRSPPRSSSSSSFYASWSAVACARRRP